MPPESEHDVEDLLGDVLDGHRVETGGPTENPADECASRPALQEADTGSIRIIPLSGVEPDRVDPDVAEESSEPAAPAEAAAREGALNEEPLVEEPNSLIDKALESQSDNSDGGAPQAGEGKSASTNAARSATRPILSVRSPVEAAEARVSYVQRVVFEQYGPRDWAIFEQYTRDAAITRLEIQDPYCCADEQARGRLVNFIGRFQQLASEIAAVHIVAFDADSVQTKEVESTSDQRKDLEQRWNRLLSSVPLHLAQKSRRSVGDLHDRYVKARLGNGDTVIWDLGRGIDGVMNARWSCVVNAFYDRSAPGSQLIH
jgi:hypothetical protein